jgi:Ca-activated chloride channel family protein
MLGRGATGGGPRYAVLPTLGACLLALALAGPALERSRVATYRNLDGVVLVVDASRSVAQGGNLVAARSAARALAEAAGSRQVAVVVYAGDAYLASPFTTDRRDVGAILDAIDGDTVPDAGSRPARALAAAREALLGAGMQGGGVVLFTDGGGLEPASAAEARGLLAAGHRVHTVHVPATASFAGLVPAGDARALAELARAGGGRATTLAELDDVLAEFGERSSVRLGRSDFAALAWADLGRALLALAAVPLLLLFRRTAR